MATKFPTPSQIKARKIEAKLKQREEELAVWRKEILDELNTEEFPVKIKIEEEMEPFVEELKIELRKSEWQVEVCTVEDYNSRDPDNDPKYLLIKPK